ncbi:hypothetical protein LTR37_021132 [Vermiconidia calcicola]|uniref:Uncharacterized protein n=1 Tax=Vermiconidia calcicola TaxID=1690605 RepID=A0ACC3M9J1_9PEZI|nr:hypothetical protein LTR37_021132 [Vermiconidia calcicola]
MAVPPVIDLTLSQPAQARQAPSFHRLPTVSASEALQELQDGNSRSVSTGLTSLDRLLSGAGGTSSGGLERGKITELWGPAGAGKSAIAIQSAVNALKEGSTVVWVDCATALSDQRIQEGITTLAPKDSHGASNGLLAEFKHVTAATLSHLLAIVLYPPPNFMPSGIGLLVVDDLNVLMDLDYPRYQFAVSSKTEQQKWQASRRYAVLSSLVSGLNKLAVIKGLAVVVITGCSTRMRPDTGLGAALVPGIGGVEWDGGVWNRLVVFRDFSGRFVGVQKCQGRSLISREEVGEIGRVVGFEVADDGTLRERQASRLADDAAAQVKPRASPVKPRKRVFDEVADSESEDVDEYGWAETDEDAIAAEGLIEGAQAATTSTEPG